MIGRAAKFAQFRRLFTHSKTICYLNTFEKARTSWWHMSPCCVGWNKLLRSAKVLLNYFPAAIFTSRWREKIKSYSVNKRMLFSIIDKHSYYFFSLLCWTLIGYPRDGWLLITKFSFFSWYRDKTFFSLSQEPLFFAWRIFLLTKKKFLSPLPPKKNLRQKNLSCTYQEKFKASGNICGSDAKCRIGHR